MMNKLTATTTAHVLGKRLNIVAYSGGVMSPTVNRQRQSVVIDIETMQAGAVDIQLDHNADQKIGSGQAAKGESLVMVAAELDEQNVFARMVVEAHAKKTGGFRQASIGGEFTQSDVTLIEPGQTIEANGTQISSEQPFMFIRNFRLTEVSVVDKGADSNSLTLSAKGKKMEDLQTQPTQDVDQMLTLLDSDLARHLTQEDVKDLRASVADGSLDVDTLDRRIKLTAKLAEVDEKSPPSHSFSPRDSRAAFNETDALTAAFMLKAGIKGVEKEFDEFTLQAADPLAKMHNMDLCKHALKLERRQSPNETTQLFAAATSTLSLPTALNNAMGKTVQMAFRQSPQTWRAFCDIKFAVNFHEQTGLRPNMLGELSKVGKDGELSHAGVSELLYKWQVETYGKTISVTRKDYVNDSTGFLSDLAPGLGRMASRKISDVVYKLLTDNTGNFFSVGNLNLISGSALSVASLGDAITKMRKQTDKNGDSIDLMPATLVVPPELEQTAKTILNSTEVNRPDSAGDSTPTGNPMRNQVGLEVEPRLSNTTKFANGSAEDWYVFAASGENPMTVGFLNNEEFQVDFFDYNRNANLLNLQWRIFGDFGTAFGEHRAAVKGDVS